MNKKNKTIKGWGLMIGQELFFPIFRIREEVEGARYNEDIVRIEIKIIKRDNYEQKKRTKA